jgi:hypothetical protein
VDRGLVHESRLERMRFQLIQVEFEMEMLRETLALLQGG